MVLLKKIPESYFTFPHDEDDPFRYHQDSPPDYSYWKKAPLWTIDESVHLIYGVKPNFYVTLSQGTSEVVPTDNAEKEIGKTKKLLELGILAGNIKTKGRIRRGGSNYLYPKDVVNWAVGQGIEVPEELLSFLKNNKKTAQALKCLDPKHKYYSEELAIAVGTWVALFENKQYISKKEAKKNPQFKNDIRKHIRKQNPKLGTTKINRIATLVNPKKSGGAQST